MADELPVYEERRGWTGRTVRGLVFVSVLDLALAALFAIARGWLGLIFVALLLLGLIVLVDGGVRKPVALRVDEHGITLTKSTARKPTMFVPWPELRAVWVVRQNRGTYSFGLTTESAPDEPRRYFPMLDWHVDSARLTETVARYAPDATIRNELPRPRASV
ncbi:MAG TPA: hypothetical protein VGM75_04225 [Pseudonocardiaceae bacterium]